MNTYWVFVLILIYIAIEKSLSLYVYPFRLLQKNDIFSVERWITNNETIGKGKMKRLYTLNLPSEMQSYSSSVKMSSVAFFLSNEMEELFRGESFITDRKWHRLDDSDIDTDLYTL